MKICYLFPGQGAQYPAMGKDLFERSQSVAELFALGSDVTSLDLKKLIFEGDEETLKQTEVTQAAITVVNLASAMVLREEGVEAAGAAGFSLGEYSALHETGVMGTEDIFRIVRLRGEAMMRAADKLKERGGEPGMAAILGLKFDEVREVIGKVRKGDVFIANYNAASQIVIAGDAAGLAEATSLLDEEGAMKIVPLKVSAPFHTPLLQPAADELAAFIEEIEFSDPVKPFYSNVTGSAVSTGKEIKRLCSLQVVSSVLWVNVEESIQNDKYDLRLEVGPGKVLSGLWRSFQRKEKCLPAGTTEDILNMKEAM